MRVFLALVAVDVVGVVPTDSSEIADVPLVFHFENANSRPTYSSIHGIGAAQQM